MNKKIWRYKEIRLILQSYYILLIHFLCLQKIYNLITIRSYNYIFLSQIMWFYFLPFLVIFGTFLVFAILGHILIVFNHFSSFLTVFHLRVSLCPFPTDAMFLGAIIMNHFCIIITFILSPQNISINSLFWRKRYRVRSSVSADVFFIISFVVRVLEWWFLVWTECKR